MREFLANVTSTSWWIGVVLVGIILNLAAAYMKPRIDESMASLSTKRRARLANKSRSRQARVDALRLDKHGQLLFAIQNLRNRLRVVMGLLLSILLFILSLFVKSEPAMMWPFDAGPTIYRIVDFVTLGIAAFMMLLSVNRQRDVIDETAILWEALYETYEAARESLTN